MSDDPDDPGGLPSPPTVAEESACVLWHRRHLRVPDHPAVAYATREYETVCPLFVFDPHFYGSDALACDARRRFLHESLVAQLDEVPDAERPEGWEEMPLDERLRFAIEEGALEISFTGPL